MPIYIKITKSMDVKQMSQDSEIVLNTRVNRFLIPCPSSSKCPKEWGASMRFPTNGYVLERDSGRAC